MGVMMMPLRSFRARQFALGNRAVTVGLESGKGRIRIGRTRTGAGQRVLEFRLADLAVTIGIDLGEQLRRRLRDETIRRLPLQRDQRGHSAGAERGAAASATG